MEDTPRIVVGIPAFNEERTIAKVVVHGTKYADRIMVVDDGSEDDTALIAERLGTIVVKHERNLGKGAALRRCIDWARTTGAEVLVTLDADGQHNPEEIPKVVDPILKREADIVIGRRSAEEVPAFRRYGARLLDRLTGVRAEGVIVDAQSGFRAYSKRALGRITPTESGMGVDSEILMRASEEGMRIVEVPVTIRYKELESSTHNPVYHGLEAFWSVLKFTSIRHPLLFYGGFSLVMFLVAVVFGVWTLNYYAKWGQVVTNLALVSVFAGILAFLSFFTGIILFTLISVIRERQ